MIFDKFFILMYNQYSLLKKRIFESDLKRSKKIHSTVKFYNPEITTVKGKVYIGENTYVNSGRLLGGINSKITIGKCCAIGHNVTISSITHDLKKPTGPDLLHKEADIEIGDDVWIGTNVFIKEGVSIGNNSVIGANSVVTKNFPPNSIIGGIPAKLIKTQTFE